MVFNGMISLLVDAQDNTTMRLPWNSNSRGPLFLLKSKNMLEFTVMENITYGQKVMKYLGK